MSNTDDDLQTILQELSSEVLKRLIRIRKETGHLVTEIYITEDDQENIRVECEIPLRASVTYLAKGALDS